MSEIRALKEVEGIRLRRVDDAQDQLRRCQQRQREAERALSVAQEELADYQKRLPGLIEQLYSDCIQRLVSRDFLADKVYDETRLRSRVEDFKGQVTEAQKALDAAVEASRQAQQRLNEERLRLDGLRELITQQRKLIRIQVARSEAKVLDDLAGSKFVRAMKRAA